MNESKDTNNKKKKIILYLVISIISVFLLAVGFYAYGYALTPQHIKKPTYQHYHFRTQILVEGKAVDFSKPEFQVKTASSATCSAEVGSIPIDFHDGIDQITHVHWNGMTGGELLKYFGWNYIGGSGDSLGQRYDTGLLPTPVKIYGKLLPHIPQEAKFYIYIGDKNSYQQKNWDDFIKQDLETFFGKKSNIGHDEEMSLNPLNFLFSKASAHGGIMDEHPSTKSEEELTSINNLIGNVVIFVQEKEPTKKQIEDRFNNLVPLRESTCGD